MVRVAEIYHESIALKKCVNGLVNTFDIDLFQKRLISQMIKYMADSADKIKKCVNEGELASAIHQNIHLKSFEEGSPVDTRQLGFEELAESNIK